MTDMEDHPFYPDWSTPQRFQEVRGARLHYVELGAGDPVLFLHGNPTSSFLWRRIAPALATRARCIALDLVGMGRSDKQNLDYSLFTHVEYVSDFVKALGLERLTLVMHDAGGFIGLSLAAGRPDLVRGLAFMESLVTPVLRWSMLPEPVRPLFRALRSEEGWALVRDQNLFIEQILKRGLSGPDAELALRSYRAPFTEPASRRAMWQFPNQLPLDGEPSAVSDAVRRNVAFLLESAIPKLMLRATPGALIPPVVGEWLARNCKQMTDIHLGDGGHYLPEEYPAEISLALRDWYERSLS